MSLQAALVGPQIKSLKGALQCLAKLGSELLLEATPHKIILRSINTARSAYAAITFFHNFFDAYEIFEKELLQTGVLLKQLLAVFRTPRLSKLTLEIGSEETKLMVTVLAENGLRKRFRIPCMDVEILQATVDKDSQPTCLVAEAGALNRLLLSFWSSLREIMTSAMSKPQILSFVDPQKGSADKSLHTQLAVDTHEVFLSYQHLSRETGDVTFNLKDFKTMLSFCEMLQCNVALHFDAAGAPLVVEPHLRGTQQDMNCEAVLILATLRESQAERLQQNPPPTVIRGPGAGPLLGHSPVVAGGRTPQVPGDTPAARPSAHGVAGRAPNSVVQPQAPPTTGLPPRRPSRFAAESAMRPGTVHAADVGAQRDPPGQPASEEPARAEPMQEDPVAQKATIHRDGEGLLNNAADGAGNHGMELDANEDEAIGGPGDLVAAGLQDTEQSQDACSLRPLTSRYLVDDDSGEEQDEGDIIPGTPPED
ncbi:hypothetical protein WJX74_011041 [Apatococcus lobatus]|uniref:Cell cycle checkpoint control protein RAD9A n=1 Tax=Apatococcus lobatus TaxID=904363 RepID=A0AAW1R4L8_9CHLO